MNNNNFRSVEYSTRGQIQITRTSTMLTYEEAITPLLQLLNHARGAVFSSNYEYPGRYTRWDIGFVNPPLVITARAQQLTVEALNQRGEVLLLAIIAAFKPLTYLSAFEYDKQKVLATVQENTGFFAEEYRSKQNSIFSLLRVIIDIFHNEQDQHLGLYGAFGYDLVFQFETLSRKLQRAPEQRDLVLYLPDEIVVVDHQRRHALQLHYDFTFNQHATVGLPHVGSTSPWQRQTSVEIPKEYPATAYVEAVEKARTAFARGDLFEVVLSQSFFELCQDQPSDIFNRLLQRNPAPYSIFLNLGEGEFLVGVSPEMFVRVTGNRVETCPISGTIARGQDAMADAKQILQLLNSDKDYAELTMCTDVDRNDKSRVCVSGSVRVISRRQIEMYSRVIHTVDHVEGRLQQDYDSIDAFLSHMWVVTVTGAPKTWAMQFIEDHEHTARNWYGGAVGWLAFNGDINTGLAIRTIAIRDNLAEVRVGATLLFDSDPTAEEKETRIKASALLDAIRNRSQEIKYAQDSYLQHKHRQASMKRVLIVDHQDSFVHTLANYFKQCGVQVSTWRNGFNRQALTAFAPELVVLSPGPGTPSDFHVSETIAMVLQQHIPLFGVCLGLQGIVEYFGGKLGVLTKPMHGKASTIHALHGRLFKGLPQQFTAARYHSLYALRAHLPQELKITAVAEDDIIMAVEHQTLPIWAVQFHPESVLTLEDNIGLRIIENVVFS